MDMFNKPVSPETEKDTALSDAEVMTKLRTFMQGNYNSQEIANAVKEKISREENE